MEGRGSGWRLMLWRLRRAGVSGGILMCAQGNKGRGGLRLRRRLLRLLVSAVVAIFLKS